MFLIRLIIGTFSLVYIFINMNAELLTFLMFGSFFWSLCCTRFVTHFDEDESTYVSLPPLRGFVLLIVLLFLFYVFWLNFLLGILLSIGFFTLPITNDKLNIWKVP